MPDCVAVVVRTPQGVLLHTGDFKVDQTPLDGEAFDLHRFAQLGAEGVLAMFCDSTNIDRRGYTGSEADVEDALRRDLHQHRRQDRRRDVFVEPLPPADRRRPGGAVRSQGGVRRPRHERELGDRAAPRLPAPADRRRDQGLATCRIFPVAGRRLPRDRLARRGQRRAVANRHRRSPPRAAQGRRSRRDFGARDSRQREGDRPGHEPPRPPRRRRRHRIEQARARVRARLRRGAEAGAVAGAAEVLRAGPRRIPPAGAACAGREVRDARAAVAGRGDDRRKRRRAAFRRRRRRASSTRRPSAAC